MTASNSLRPARGSRHHNNKRRHLQKNGNNNDNTDETLPPTISPTTPPTARPTRTPLALMRPSQSSSTVAKIPTAAPTVTPPLYRAYVSFQWSILLLDDEEDDNDNDDDDSASNAAAYKKGVMADWFLQDFLCQQQEQEQTASSSASISLWMAQPMDILKSDCPHTDENEEETANSLHSIASSSNNTTILWNEPIATWYPELLEDRIHYEVWNIQYPLALLFANWTTTEAEEIISHHHQRIIQEELQSLLNDRIAIEVLQSDRGVVSIVGRELETYLLSNSGSYTQDGPTISLQPPPPTTATTTLTQHSPDALVVIGALIALIHTLALICLHLFVRPSLKERIETKALETKQELSPTATKSFQSDDDPMSFPSTVYPIQSSQDDNARFKSSSSSNSFRHKNPNARTLFLDTPVPSLLTTPQMPSDDDSSDLLSRSHISVVSSTRRMVTTEEEEEEVEVQSLILGSVGGTAQSLLLAAPYGNRDGDTGTNASDDNSEMIDFDMIVSC